MKLLTLVLSYNIMLVFRLLVVHERPCQLIDRSYPSIRMLSHADECFFCAVPRLFVWFFITLLGIWSSFFAVPVDVSSSMYCEYETSSTRFLFLVV